MQTRFKNPIDFPTQEFDNAMRFVKLILETEKNIEDKLIILDYILRVVKEDLKSDLLSYIFYSQIDFCRQLESPFTLFYEDEQGNKLSLKEEKTAEISLPEDCILTLPWHWGRMRAQIKNLFHSDFVFDKHNHRAYYFPYLGLCYVYNGKHTVSCGIVYKKGKIEAEQYDITVLFPHIYTDGESWYNCHTHEKKADLADFRLGIIYEVAKIKHQIETFI